MTTTTMPSEELQPEELSALLSSLMPEIPGYRLLRRIGRSEDAVAAYDAAIAATENEAERAYLSRRRAQLRR